MRYWGLALLWVSVPVAARAEPRPIEVGGFVGVDFLPRDVELGNSWAPDQVPGSGPTVGGRATWWILPALAGDRYVLDVGVEGEARVAVSSTSSDPMAGRKSYASPIVGVGAHLVAALRTGTPVTPHVLAGGGANTLFTSSPYARDDLDPVGYWGLGVSWKLGARLALRVDVRQGVEAGRMNDLTSTFSAEVGLATVFGAGPAFPTGGEIARVEPPPHEPPPHEPPPPSDRDGDGVIDAMDRCPDEPEDRDGFADDDGCPDPDNDGDGIADAADACPNEAETVNGIDDADGCPDAVPAEVVAIEGRGGALTFIAKARLRPAAQKALDGIAATLRKFPAIRLRVEGHAGKGVTDDLAKRRAEAVKWYLIDAGIAADRIDAAAVAADASGARVELHLAIAPSPAP